VGLGGIEADSERVAPQISLDQFLAKSLEHSRCASEAGYAIAG